MSAAQLPAELRVAVITRLKNQNSGNEALSYLLLRLLERELPDFDVRAVDRTPPQFRAFRLAALGAAEDEVVSRFDALAGALAATSNPEGRLAPRATSVAVELSRRPRTTSPRVATLKRAVGFRRHLARFGLYRRGAFTEALDTIAASELVIWHPAGEVHDRTHPDEILGVLLLLRASQQLGRRTAVVNHTLEVSHPLLRALLAQVYGASDFVSVRERQSYDEAIGLGIDARRLHEIPDLSLLAVEEEPEELSSLGWNVPRGAIGLAINGPQVRDGPDEWEELLTGLVSFGRPIAFVSNAMHEDLELARRLAGRHSLALAPRQLSFRELLALYGGLDVLVSSRLHASVFAMCSSTPVVTIEPLRHKLTAFTAALGYPLPTVGGTEPGWSRHVLEVTRTALRERSRIGQAGRRLVEDAAARIHGGYEPLFALARRL